jgi:DNA-binding PadR family transcriptional regulator
LPLNLFSTYSAILKNSENTAIYDRRKQKMSWSGWDFYRRRTPGWARAWRHRGWLRPMILFLLSKKPMNGVELMNEIQISTMGNWRPSPGSLYPILYELTDEGLIVKGDDGKYKLTDEGKEFVKATWMAFYVSPDPSFMIENINSYLDILENLIKENKDMLSIYKESLKKLKERIDHILNLKS